MKLPPAYVTHARTEISVAHCWSPEQQEHSAKPSHVSVNSADFPITCSRGGNSTSRNPSRSKKRSNVLNRGPSSTQQATSASTTQNTTSIGACARTLRDRQISLRSAPTAK